VFWIIMILYAKKEYVNAFRLAIDKRSINVEEPSVNLDDPAVFDLVQRTMEDSNERKILYILDLVENSRNPKLVPHLRKLLSHDSFEIRETTLKMLANFPGQDFTNEVSPLAADENDAVRIEAIGYLVRKTKDKVARMNEFLRSDQESIQVSALM